MAALNELIDKIENPELRAQIQEAANKLAKQKKFGLVFEEHLPECTPLYDIPVKKGATVSLKSGSVNNTFKVLKIENGKAWCMPKSGNTAIEYPVEDLVVTAEFGEAIYPCLKLLDSVCNASDSDLWHTLIEADNYHALQLLEYLYAGKVDCIYIDPPYNSGATDWKYNNKYVDENDEYKHSKWLSFMQKRLEIAKRLLNPYDSILIVTIDEKEYLHLGCLLEEMFSYANIQMVSSVINRAGTGRKYEFSRTDEYLFFVRIGSASIALDGSEGQNTPVVWDTLRRSGPTNTWNKTKKQFYPVFVDDSTKKIHSVGDPLIFGVDKMCDVVAPAGCTAVFPIRDNGMEMMWGCVKEEFLARLNKGYIRVGKHTPNKPQKYVISYLTGGIISDIESGKAFIKNICDDGSVNAFYYESKEIPPTTNWNKHTHDAQWFGSNIVKSILTPNRFSYPKSLYAVKDCLYYATANKPNALIVDFFAGSGTTLHATNLLNAEDGGKRRCIMITNNEISEAEKNEFEARGIKQGDEEWENKGIARYVTWPRTVCSILGKDVNGNPLDGDYGVIEEEYIIDDEDTIVSKKTGKPTSKKIYIKKEVQKLPQLAEIKRSDGFHANAVFFKLGFLDKTKVSLGMQFKELLSTLWMKAGAIGECPTIDGNVPEMLILPKNKMAILNNENAFAEFKNQLDEHPEIEVVYLVTDYEAGFVSMTKALEGKKTYQLYRDYLDNFRINAGRNSR
ncbi:MAG: site-specific DNA-methyltransferase [Clostridia bacterium]|nr:site-specific DNA-methyltransferase [Clostridia bacterium]